MIFVAIVSLITFNCPASSCILLCSFVLRPIHGYPICFNQFIFVFWITLFRRLYECCINNLSLGFMAHHNRWALILGASSGFGAACTRALANAGLNIVGVHFDLKS